MVPELLAQQRADVEKELENAKELRDTAAIDAEIAAQVQKITVAGSPSEVESAPATSCSELISSNLQPETQPGADLHQIFSAAKVAPIIAGIEIESPAVTSAFQETAQLISKHGEPFSLGEMPDQLNEITILRLAMETIEKEVTIVTIC